MKYINKIWLYKFRIIMWLLILSGTHAEFIRTQSYWEAALNGFGIWWVMWIGSVAYCEKMVIKIKNDL